MSAFDTLETLVEAVEALDDSVAKGRARALVTGVLEMHREGLERVLEILAEEEGGDARIKGLAADPALASLLMLHDLHPSTPLQRVEEALASLDPELAEDRRVQMARKLLTGTKRVGRFVGRTLELELELNEYESEPPAEKKPLRSGRLQTTHAQRWLLLRCGALEFEVHVDATLVQDGIEVVGREESERFAVRLSGVETPIRAHGWTDQSTDCLCTMPELEAALDAALDAAPTPDSESE